MTRRTSVQVAACFARRAAAAAHAASSGSKATIRMFASAMPPPPPRLCGAYDARAARAAPTACERCACARGSEAAEGGSPLFETQMQCAAEAYCARSIPANVFSPGFPKWVLEARG